MTSARPSLIRQIAEVKRELGERERVYRNLVEQGRMKQGAADYQIETMVAVLDTLEWCQRNAETIRRVVAEIKGERGRPGEAGP